MFGCKIIFLPARPGERYASALTKMYLSNKVQQLFGQTNLNDYIRGIVKKSRFTNTFHCLQ